jgi:hypothetical protein
LGGDELEAQFGGALLEERHASWTDAAARCSTFAHKNFTRRCSAQGSG